MRLRCVRIQPIAAFAVLPDDNAVIAKRAVDRDISVSDNYDIVNKKCAYPYDAKFR